MKRLRSLALVVASAVAVLAPLTAHAAATADSLMALVRERNNTIMAIVKSPTGGETEKEREKLKEIVGDLFDFQAFARESLGRYWDERSAAERAEFAELCRQLIEKNYADPALYKKAEETTYVSAESATADEGVVKTVVRYKTEKSMVDYRLHRQGGRWRIYDMVIDDLSVAESNRSQFRKEIRKSSYEGLVQKLRDKLAEG